MASGVCAAGGCSAARVRRTEFCETHYAATIAKIAAEIGNERYMPRAPSCLKAGCKASRVPDTGYCQRHAGGADKAPSARAPKLPKGERAAMFARAVWASGHCSRAEGEAAAGVTGGFHRVARYARGQGWVVGNAGPGGGYTAGEIEPPAAETA